MWTLYWVAASIGGTMILASMFFGADTDTDTSEVSKPDSIDVDVDGVMAWLPITSVRFWIFFTAFFGVCGVALTYFAIRPAFLVPAISIGTGYVCGVAVVMAFRKLTSDQPDSTTSLDDIMGHQVLVVVPVTIDAIGKVRSTSQGKTVEYLATTDDKNGFEKGDTALVYEATADGSVRITRSDQVG